MNQFTIIHRQIFYGILFATFLLAALLTHSFALSFFCFVFMVIFFYYSLYW